MITVFKNPKIEAYANETYTTGFVPHTKLYPGIREDRMWQNAKDIARQAWGIDRQVAASKITKKQIFNNLIPNDEGR